MIDEELRKAREEVLATHLKGESTKTLEMVLSTMPEPTYDLVTLGIVIKGRDKVGRFLQNLFDMLGPNTHIADRIYHTETDAIVEVTTVFPDGFDGKEKGNEIKVRTVGIFPFDGATLLSEKLYANPEQIIPLLEGV